MPAEPSDAERAAVDELLGPPDTGWVGGERGAGAERRFARGGHAARARRDLLLPALHALQSAVGWISQGGLTINDERIGSIGAAVPAPVAGEWLVIRFGKRRLAVGRRAA